MVFVAVVNCLRALGEGSTVNKKKGFYFGDERFTPRTDDLYDLYDLHYLYDLLPLFYDLDISGQMHS